MSIKKIYKITLIGNWLVRKVSVIASFFSYIRQIWLKYAKNRQLFCLPFLIKWVYDRNIPLKKGNERGEYTYGEKNAQLNDRHSL